MRQSKVIGLTGGSGSGKSTVAGALRSAGAYIIDCDRVAHENMLKGAVAYGDIVADFGSDILLENGEIDRKKLGAVVFSDEKALERLNKITHKHIIARVEQLVSSSEAEVTVIDAPLLYETGLDRLCDEVWVTEAPYEERVKRITERDGITKQAAEARLKNQGSYTGGDRRIVTNFATIAELEKYIRELL